MQLMAATRALSWVLLGGTLIGFVPEQESATGTAAGTLADSPVSGARVYAEGAVCRVPGLDDFDSAGQADTETVQVAQIQGGADSGVGKPREKEYVKAKVFLSVDKLPAGDKCKFAVVLNVQEGWHINANPPSPDNMIPTKVTIVAKQKTTQLETKYPKGMTLKMEELEEPVSVYEGEVLIRGELLGSADSAGKTEELEFQIRYQACNEQTCLPPKTLKLQGKIDIVKAGTPVKQINEKYFVEKK